MSSYPSKRQRQPGPSPTSSSAGPHAKRPRRHAVAASPQASSPPSMEPSSSVSQSPTASLSPPSSSLLPTPTSVSSSGKFGNSYFLGPNENHPQWWTLPLRRPDTFPRDDWTSATWAPPDMSSKQLYVTGGLFQWAGKFASVAVAEAIEGKVSWEVVGDHGVYLAIVDLMLQCRDFLRLEKCAARLRERDRSKFYITHDVWLERCSSEAERIYELALNRLPASVRARLSRGQAQRLCLAAVVNSFQPIEDASTQPPLSGEHRIPISFLGQYDTTADQLAKYGVNVIQGSIPLHTTEDELLSQVMAWHAVHGSPDRNAPNLLLGRPLETPIPPRVGRLPGPRNAHYVVMPRKRGEPASATPERQQIKQRYRSGQL